MPTEPFLSYAQNGEDVVLWRALQGVGAGTYVEVGGNDPTELSVSRAFYDRGWHGVVVEPVAGFVAAFRRERPRDRVVQAAAASTEGEVVLHQIDGTGLSSLDADVAASQQGRGYDVVETTVAARRLDAILDEQLREGEQVHWLLVDVEGAEADVLRSIDLRISRPWVLVVEATAPLGTEPTHEQWEPEVLAAGYTFCLFDGLSRFYVADEHADLRTALSYPACALDEAMRWQEVKLVRSRGEVQAALDATRAELAVLRATPAAALPGPDLACDGAAGSDRTEQAEHAEHADTGPGRVEALRTELDAATADLQRWRTLALDGWAVAPTGASALGAAHGAAPSVGEAALRREIVALQRTLSWRITRPLRVARRLQLGPGGGR